MTVVTSNRPPPLAMSIDKLFAAMRSVEDSPAARRHQILSGPLLPNLGHALVPQEGSGLPDDVIGRMLLGPRDLLAFSRVLRASGLRVRKIGRRGALRLFKIVPRG